MSPSPFFLPGPAGRLEALLREPDQPRAAAVVCHPNPLGGGTMHNTVVFRMASGLADAGVAALRFQFRGVGRSAGVSEGSEAEVGDAEAALDHLARLYPGLPLWAAGFSFGARTVAALAARDPRVARVVLVALPTLAFDISAACSLRVPGLVVTAGADRFGNRADLEERCPDLPETLDVHEVEGADHFFRGRTRELEALLRDWVAEALR